MKKLLKLASALGLTLLSLASCSEPTTSTVESASVEEEVTFTNPILMQDFADPYVFRDDDGTWYAYATEGGVMYSKDLVSWRSGKKVELPTWGSPGAHIWAPCVQKFGDTYLYYYALSAWGDPNPGIGIMTSDSAAGPFTDTGALFRSNDIGVPNSIDPDVFKDPVTGKSYIIWGSFNGIWANELSEDGMSLVGEKTEIISSHDYEAPNLYYKNNKYYLFLSAGSCCEGANSTYNVQVYTADSVLGPYTKSPYGDSSWSGSILHQLPDGQNVNGRTVYGPGHTVIIEDDAGVNWLFYHGFYSVSGKLTTRILFMDKVEWTSDGYPYVAGYVPSLTEKEGPTINED